MVGKANWDNCKSCLERNKERKKEMLLSKIVEYKVRNSTKCQDGLDGWVDNGLQKGPFYIKGRFMTFRFFSMNWVVSRAMIRPPPHPPLLLIKFRLWNMVSWHWEEKKTPWKKCVHMRLTCPPFGVHCWKLVATSLSILESSLGGDPCCVVIWIFLGFRVIEPSVPTFEIFKTQRTIG